MVLGIVGIIQSRNLWVAMLSIELLYLGVVSSFLVAGIALNSVTALIYSLLFIVLAASESAIGLGLLIILFRFGKTIQFDSYRTLRG